MSVCVCISTQGRGKCLIRLSALPSGFFDLQLVRHLLFAEVTTKYRLRTLPSAHIKKSVDNNGHISRDAWKRRIRVHFIINVICIDLTVTRRRRQ